MVTNFYTFRVTKTLKRLDRVLGLPISSELWQHQRVSFSMTVTQEARLESEIQFLQQEQLVFFSGPDREEYLNRSGPDAVRAIPLPKLKTLFLCS